MYVALRIGFALGLLAGLMAIMDAVVNGSSRDLQKAVAYAWLPVIGYASIESLLRLRAMDKESAQRKGKHSEAD